ncbi:unnamed protein product [Gadus morhua 'NCC']
MRALGLLLLLGLLSGGSAVIHSLRYFDTGSSGLSSFPEFVSVGMVDEVQFVHYDSVRERAVPKQAWMEQVTRDDTDYWERAANRGLGKQQVFKGIIETVKKRFNQTGGATLFRVMSGCEWDDEDDTTDGHEQYAYDGEDFIAFDLKTLTWVALGPPAPQAEVPPSLGPAPGDVCDRIGNRPPPEAGLHRSPPQGVCLDMTTAPYRSLLSRTESPRLAPFRSGRRLPAPFQDTLCLVPPPDLLEVGQMIRQVLLCCKSHLIRGRCSNLMDSAIMVVMSLWKTGWPPTAGHPALTRNALPSFFWLKDDVVASTAVHSPKMSRPWDRMGQVITFSLSRAGTTKFSHSLY